MTYSIGLMQQDDIPEVSRVERLCFSNPWPSSAYRRELRNPTNNYYIVLREQEDAAQRERERERERGEGRGLNVRLPLQLPFLRRGDDPTSTIVGFAGMWILFDEAHITTIGVLPEQRGRGLGELMLVDLFAEAERRKAEWLTLEVRVSNEQAQRLYMKYGFHTQGVRRRYYSDNNEDAYIMWSESLHNPEYLARVHELRERLFARLGDTWNPARAEVTVDATPVAADTSREPADSDAARADTGSRDNV